MILACKSVVGEKGRGSGFCGVRNVKVLTKHLVVEFTEDSKIIRSLVVPNFEDFRVGRVSQELVALISMPLIWHRIRGFARGVVPVCWLAHLI